MPDEQWQQLVETRLSRLELESAVEAERYRQLTERLDSIDGHLGWIFKSVLGAIIIAVVTFIVKGGLIL
tara:strand:- start:336 stop:542 length:207 start_codon:yes stop_codon:yes gene_type:complete